MIVLLLVRAGHGFANAKPTSPTQRTGGAVKPDRSVSEERLDSTNRQSAVRLRNRSGFSAVASL
jgi:hypothetical protein